MFDNLSTDDYQLIALIAILIVVALIAALLTYKLITENRAPANGGDAKPSGLWHLIQREPVRVRAAATTILGAVGVLLASLGIDIDPAVMAAIIGVIAAVAFAISELSRPVVTPVADPVVPKGTTVKRV